MSLLRLPLQLRSCASAIIAMVVPRPLGTLTAGPWSHRSTFEHAGARVKRFGEDPCTGVPAPEAYLAKLARLELISD